MKRIISIQLFLIGCAMLFAPHIAFAADAPLVNVGLEVPFGETNAVLGLADYIARLYIFIVSSIGIIAAVMIMFHGFQWAAAAGNSDIIGKAKDGILHAIIGIVLAFSSYMILNFINPALIQSTNPAIPIAAAPAHHDDSGSCAPGDTVCESGTKYLVRPISGEKIAIPPCQVGAPDPDYIVTVSVFGMTTKIHKDLVKSLKAVDAEWNRLGGDKFYPINAGLNNSRGSELEGFNCRNVQKKDANGNWYDTGRPSNHSYGVAIDINPATNPYTEGSSIKTDMPPAFLEIWKKNGWGWGGKFKDPQHFSKLENEDGDGYADPN